ncbi:hypothetical protein DPMN_006307 [Dreissena polymorpha]|uniref:Uncharacterized protein n=1 Tax=Dreissena polymorpha TaxID=45954 RepID=A0A9D4MV03_DREPO|nr:hypothetical protein DPMN_006307 [Dreissena polymorpha]
MHTLGKPELSENRTIRPVPRPSGLQRVYCILTKKNAPHTGGHVFQATGTIFELVKNIIGTNLLTKFHDDRTINTASRVLTRKNATPPWRPYIIVTNHHTKFHNDRTINVASRVLTRKNAPPLTNLLTKFHEDWTISVVFRVFTSKNAPPLCSPVFQANVTIFELIQDIIQNNLLTKVHEDWAINVAASVNKENAPPLRNHTNLLTKFHEDWTINVACRVLKSQKKKNAPPPGGRVFTATETIFELIKNIIGTNLLTKFHQDRKINVDFRVLTRFYYSYIRKNAPPAGGHVFQANVIIFKLIKDIIETNPLTKFHEDWTINVTSRVFTRQLLMPHD